MALMKWVRLPSDWINYRHGLKKLQWKGDGVGSDATAALMALTAIAHHANDQSGIAWRTYDALCLATGLSRAKLSNECRKDAVPTSCVASIQTRDGQNYLP
jgi:hypothetical protein